MSESALQTLDHPQPLTESLIRDAIVQARGDLFVAAQLCGHVTVLRLDRAIRASEDLQLVFLALKDLKALEEYDRFSQQQIEQEVARRLTVYRSDALDALHELATMAISDNSAQNQVKLLAAQRLAGGADNNGGALDIDVTLRQLNDDYHKHAIRVKSVRERVIEFEGTEALPPGS